MRGVRARWERVPVFLHVRGCRWVSFSVIPHGIVGDRVSYLELTSTASQLVPSNLPVPTSLTLGMTGTHRHAWLLRGYWGFELGSPHLSSKHSVCSPAPTPPWILTSNFFVKSTEDARVYFFLPCDMCCVFWPYFTKKDPDISWHLLALPTGCKYYWLGDNWVSLCSVLVSVTCDHWVVFLQS